MIAGIEIEKCMGDVTLTTPLLGEICHPKAKSQ